MFEPLTMFDFEPFLVRALLAGLGIALISGVIGCFVLWRRMAYFGDSLAHSALLGIGFGLALNISPHLGTALICSLFALSLLWLQQKKMLTTDTVLGILAHGALASGVVIMSLLNQRIDLHAYLFGDILTVTSGELGWIYIGGIIALALLWLNWQSLILMTINEDLAMADNIRVFFTQMLLMFLMTLVVALSIHIVGILLISSMLIIPAAIARQWARSPEIMALAASLMGASAVMIGILGSVQWDTPPGPSIVVSLIALFILSAPIAHFVRGQFDKAYDKPYHNHHNDV